MDIDRKSTSDEVPPEEELASSWETKLIDLLSSLSTAQDELLDLLSKKRQMLVDADMDKLAEIQPREEALMEKLQDCQDRRTNLLQQASEEGLPADSIASLTSALSGANQNGLGKQVYDTQLQSRILQHHSLTNWVLTQRTLIHLSQMLEIIATGGRLQPTYEKGKSSPASGSLLDHAA